MRYKLLKDLPHAKAGIYELEKDTALETIMSNNEYSFLITRSWLTNKEWFEEIKEVKSIYDIKVGTQYWFLGSRDYVNSDLLELGSEHLYNDRMKMGNIFLTREEAETELQKRKKLAGFKKYCHDNPEDIQAQSVLSLLENKEIEVIDYFNIIH